MMDLSQLSIKRQLKRAKLFEIQKIVKQIRMLENRKGTDAQLQKSKRKLERLAEVLDALKDLSRGDLAEELCQNLQKGSQLPSSRDIGEQAAGGSCLERAKHRLLTNKAFQRSISRLSGSNKLGSKDGGHDATSLEVVRTKEEGESSESGCGSGRNSPPLEGLLARERGGVAASDGVASSEAESDREPEEGVGLGDDATDDSLEPQTRRRAGSRRRRHERVATRETGAKRRGRVSVDEKECPPLSGGGEGLSRRMQLESLFVGTLSGSSYTPAKCVEKTAKRLKGNRPGQRTRQKKWEEMFGGKAKHVAEGKQKGKKRTRGAKRVAERCGVTKQKVSLVSKLEVKEAGPQLHPSWEARRRKKAMETGIPQFQGQKTVFSD